MTTDFNPTWQTFENVSVLRVGDSDMIAVPATGKKSAAKFMVISASTREVVCYLTKKEVHSWLFRVARGAAQDAIVAAESRAIRIARVQAYLATRAARPVQLAFNL